MKTLNKIVRWPFVALISLYQHTISPDHGIVKPLFSRGYCQYSPSCSEYAKQSIQKHGVVKGSIMGTWRILRCNPWSHGGSDPVPEKFWDAFKR